MWAVRSGRIREGQALHFAVVRTDSCNGSEVDDPAGESGAKGSRVGSSPRMARMTRIRQRHLSPSVKSM